VGCFVAELFKSILMGIGCLGLMGFAGCSMLGASAIVAADRAIEASEKVEAEEKGPWDK
jgi:threonine dehydrogenase-like Zn-dependent dehydrogenase